MWEKMKIMMSGIWEFILPFLRQMMSQAGPILASAAMAAVTATAQNMGSASGDEKRQAAFNSIVTDLEKQGINLGVQISASMVNAAIELALQKYKAQ